MLSRKLVLSVKKIEGINKRKFDGGSGNTCKQTEVKIKL